MGESDFSKPEFFVVTDYVAIPVAKLGLPKFSFGNHVYLLCLGHEHVCDPSNDPIIAYYEAGVHRYLWRDLAWAQHDCSYQTLFSVLYDLGVAYGKSDMGDRYTSIMNKLYQSRFDSRFFRPKYITIYRHK